MTSSVSVRPAQPHDYAAWRPLWDGYNAFYGRAGETAPAAALTAATWERFFDGMEPMEALVAEWQGRLLGLAHIIFHRNGCFFHRCFNDFFFGCFRNDGDNRRRNRRCRLRGFFSAIDH